MVTTFFLWPAMLLGYIGIRVEGFISILKGEMTIKEFWDEIGF